MLHEDPNVAAWQAYALQRLDVEPVGSRPVPQRMEWTRVPGRGPGAELLGDVEGRHVAELGCGPGDNIAHLVAECGAIGNGIDGAWAQVRRARRSYGHVPDLTFTGADARAHLEKARTDYHVCYSVFGAVGLTPPGDFLGAVASRLLPGGLLAFSVIHPARPGVSTDDFERPRISHLTLTGGARYPLVRYLPTKDAWLRFVKEADLTVTEVLSFDHEADQPDTLIITARKL